MHYRLFNNSVTEDLLTTQTTLFCNTQASSFALKTQYTCWTYKRRWTTDTHTHLFRIWSIFSETFLLSWPSWHELIQDQLMAAENIVSIREAHLS